MNLKKLQIPAAIFMAGYTFQYVDHFHRAILNHGYTLAILMLAVFGTLWAANKLGIKRADTHIDLDFRPVRNVHLIEHEPVEQSHVLKTEQTIKRHA